MSFGALRTCPFKYTLPYHQSFKLSLSTMIVLGYENMLTFLEVLQHFIIQYFI